MSELAHNCCIVAVFPETVTATGGALLLAVQGSLCLICAIDWFSGHSGDNAGMTAANTGHQSHDNCQAQHVGDLQRGLIHVWNLYEFNIYTKKYDDSTESLMWWKGGKWSSYHHRSWKEETTVEDSPASEKRILRWVAYLQSFVAYLKKMLLIKRGPKN